MNIRKIRPNFLKKLLISFNLLYCGLIAPPFDTIWKYRSMLYQTSIHEVKTRHAGSVLGLFWLVIYPLLFLGSYAIVYVFIFKIRFPELSSKEYVTLIFCGLIPFLGFSEGLSLGVSSIVSSSNLIKNTLFPIDLVPVKAVLVGQATQCVGMALLLIVLAFLGKITIYTPLVFLVWILQLLFSIGLIWILSSLNVYLRDIQNIVPILTLILMMLSPIAYTEQMIPENLKLFLAINPLYYLIISYQSLFMFGHLPGLKIIIPLAIFSSMFFMIGFWFFSKMKKLFTDNL